MQYLKDEIREKIIEKALIEFSKKGYKGASIRVIAKNSGTSVGNMYKYFNSKESLYETLIGGVYNKLMDYIGQFRKVEINENAQKIFIALMDKIIEIFKENSLELSILLNKSAGSKYENCKSVFIDYITRIVTENMKFRMKLTKLEQKNNYIIYILSYSLVESISLILREKKDGEEVKQLILKIIDIFYTDLEIKLNEQISY
ncbi:TetR/AcrR family transcriptional regulator [Clostridium oryzae]|uniref:Putative HTH-type transcriptional regulator YttP n=1 Tax=Clostridium oryzae TaxID=1450648 RepID=A0A1V4IR25_9CLOT|nr:TetR/AcrR family transcriptional regulator [Clostridium oryzae]OPJ61927.1 putative HTH-type transcriptional regulator YttP [Clostridium oryzae]